jgi:Leucine-rich repeat (LRR) protein
MRGRTAAADAISADPLHAVLEHLGTTDENGQLYKTVARALHRSSKQYQASARATLSHLSLDKYYCQPSDRYMPALPWALLKAFSAVTSLSLAAQQLAPLAHRRDEPAVKALLGQLKRLSATVCLSVATFDAPAAPLGQLLWACRQLEEVDVHVGDYVEQPWLLLDPDSTSSSSAVGPPLPLRSLTTRGMPLPLVTGWMQQQQRQLGRTLQRLEVGPGSKQGVLDLGQLTGLVALRDLQLCGSDITASTHLTSMSSVTQLGLAFGSGTTAAVEAVCTLPNLQHLSVEYGSLAELPDSVSALKQLSCLNISHTAVQQLPEDLGVWCPGLVQLEASDSRLVAVPASLGSLTRLNMAWSSFTQLVLPTTLTRLRQLDVQSAGYGTIVGISSLVALEHLENGAFKGDLFGGRSLGALRPLTRLCHFSLYETWVADATTFTAMGALQQLTSLDLSHHQFTEAGWSALGRAEPLAALQQLDLSWCGPHHALLALQPWLSRLTTLTLLRVCGIACGSDTDLAYLPPKLQELTLCCMPGTWEMPLGLLSMSALRVLNISGNRLLCELPSWCSQLHNLEQLDLQHTGVLTEQPVLAQMPALHAVSLTAGQAVVCGAVPHLRV